MAINIAVFVPEGIVISSDCLSEICNNDDGFTQTNANRTFTIWDKCIISFIHADYPNGLPYGYYINKFKEQYFPQDISIRELSVLITNFFKEQYKLDNIVYYIAGFDKKDNSFVPFLFLKERENFQVINQDLNQKEVYNYHAIGRTYWVNKVLLKTEFYLEDSKENIAFDAVDIDFSKYSIDDAIQFSMQLISFSATLDNFAQIKQSISMNTTTAVITSSDGCKLI